MAYHSVADNLTQSDGSLLSIYTYSTMHKTGSEVGMMERKLRTHYTHSNFI